MEQYIPKSVVLAEIEKLYNGEIDTYTRNILDRLKSNIDTIKVKELNLEEAIDDYIYTHDGRKRLALELDWKCCNLTLKGGDEIIKFAKHFFELGMAVSNKAQKGE